jgi:hypothetical protein
MLPLCWLFSCCDVIAVVGVGGVLCKKDVIGYDRMSFLGRTGHYYNESVCF